MNPDKESIINYINQKKYIIDPIEFYNHYQDKNWILNGSPIKDYRKLIDIWQENELKKEAKLKSYALNYKEEDMPPELDEELFKAYMIQLSRNEKGDHIDYSDEDKKWANQVIKENRYKKKITNANNINNPYTLNYTINTN